MLGTGQHIYLADDLQFHDLDARLVPSHVGNNLRAIYLAAGQKDDLQFYYIAMPRFLRTSGSFGTHWMLQNTIKEHDSVTKPFSGIRVVRALRAAYGCRDAGDSAELVNWIRSSPEFSSWCTLRRGLKNGSCACSPPQP